MEYIRLYERRAIMNSLKEIIVSFMKEEDGFGVVEVILIIVVLIGLVIIFRDSITNVIENIFDTISERVDEV
jgi:Flp pilus assembly pilin Flp